MKVKHFPMFFCVINKSSKQNGSVLYFFECVFWSNFPGFCDTITKSQAKHRKLQSLVFLCVTERERERELIMEEGGGNGMNVSHKSSRRENFVPQDVESASRSEMSSGSWRLRVHEFPALAERRDREHGFFTLRTLLHAPSKAVTILSWIMICVFENIDI